MHALLGENGAGKCTLMKILFGLQQPDAGEVLLDGEPLRLRSPADAIAAGIGMIHQHFMLVPTLTVAENVALGAIPPAGGPQPAGGARVAAVAARLAELSAAYEVDVDPSAYVWQLSVGERQRVEILKVLYRATRLLVLDEPTAVLTPGEVEQLFATLRRDRRRPAAGWCSSPTSSTRCCRSPIASRSCATARSPARCCPRRRVASSSPT